MSKPIKQRVLIRLRGRSKSAEKWICPLSHKEDGNGAYETDNNVSRQLTGKLALRSTTKPAFSSSSYSSPWSSSSSYIETKDREKKETDKRVLCIYCSKRRRRVLFDPCNHMLVCDMCFECIDMCPQCDTKVEEGVCLV